jgi:hypothetical protein
VHGEGATRDGRVSTKENNTTEIEEGRPYDAPMTPLSLFGLFAVTAMLVCYAYEQRSPWFILAFAISCWLGSVYGFLQGAWPFGLVEGIWGVVAIRRWREARMTSVHSGDIGAR